MKGELYYHLLLVTDKQKIKTLRPHGSAEVDHEKVMSVSAHNDFNAHIRYHRIANVLDFKVLGQYLGSFQIWVRYTTMESVSI